MKGKKYVRLATQFLDLQYLLEEVGSTHYLTLDDGAKDLEKVKKEIEKFLKNYKRWKEEKEHAK